MESEEALIHLGGEIDDFEEGLLDLVEWGFNQLLTGYRFFLETLIDQKTKGDVQELTEEPQNIRNIVPRYS